MILRLKKTKSRGYLEGKWGVRQGAMPWYVPRMTNAVMVWMTAPNAEVAEKIARALVTESLAACVNLIPHVRSIYRWEGKIEDTAEVLMLAKTTVAGFEPLAARVKGLHPYQVPEIIAVPVPLGNAPYLKWLDASIG